VTAVLGPGGRGVIVLVEPRPTDLRDLLAAAGFPSCTPVEAGLAAGISSARAAGKPAEAARFFAEATRRPALSQDVEEWLVAAPDGSVLRGGDPGLLCGQAMAVRAPPRVAVFGGAWIEERDPEYRDIVGLGRALAERGRHLVCGGYQGAMAAACRGVSDAGGVAVGVTITAWKDVVDVNPWVTHELLARDLFARLPVITDADAWVAFSGGVGTLQEVALCWNLVQTGLAEPRPLILVGERWDRQLRLFRELLLVSDTRHFDLVRPAASLQEALELLA
jgi:uncharacterized protein (TIGR00730 family)